MTPATVSGRLIAVAILICAFMLAPIPRAAMAQDAAVAAFFGHWQGSGVSESEVSLSFRMTARDLDVIITSSGNGFSLSWTTVQRQKGDPNNPDVERKGTEIIFLPSGKPGVWHEAQSGGQGTGSLAGGRYAWSRVEGNTLVTQIVEIDDEGRSNLHIYRRTLSGTGMTLEFRRLVDGELVRTVDGKMIKIAN